MITTTLLGYTFVNESIDFFIDQLPGILRKPGFHLIATLNPEIIVRAKSESFAEALIRKSICVADGTGLVMAARIRLRQKLHKITGMELVLRLLAQERYSFYWVGAQPEVIEKAVEQTQKDFPKSDIKGYHHGFFSTEDERCILEDIERTRPDFILVGMGFPKQELFLQKVSQQVHYGIGIGIGGVFDVLSHTKKRAPKLIRTLGLEWVFRGLIEPKRIRRWGVIPRFAWDVIFKPTQRYCSSKESHSEKELDE